METNNINANTLQAVLKDYAGKENEIISSNMKGFFKDVYQKLQKITLDFADSNTTHITIDGKSYRKSDAGTLALIGILTSQLQNYHTFGMELVTKNNAIGDQTDKLVA